MPRGRPPSAKTLVDRQLGRNVKHPILPAGEDFIVPNYSGVGNELKEGLATDLGSQGSILFLNATGNIAEDNTNFFWDDTNNQLQLGAGTAALPSFTFKGDPNTGIFNSNTDRLTFTTAGAAKWEIVANGHWRCITDNSFDIGAAGGNRPRHIYAGGKIRPTIGNASFPAHGFDGDTNTGMFGAAADELGFSTGSSEAMRIDSSQRVIIGGTSTSKRLQVTGDTTTELEVSGTVKGQLTLNRDDSSIGTGNDIARIVFSGDAGSAGQQGATILAQARGTWGASDAPTALIFSTAPDGGSVTEAMRINSSQQVTATDGTVLLPAFAFTSDPDTGIYLETAGELRIVTAGTARMVIKLGSIDLQTNTLINIGDNGTDFTSSGGLNLAGPLDIDSSISLNIVAKTANYTATTSDHTITCSGTFTVTLPAATGVTGIIYNIKNTGTGTITVDGSGAETIDGATTAVLSAQFGSIMIICDGSNWHII